jgi:hypothetical protein
VAVTSTDPAALPNVSCVDAVPFASVTAVAGATVAVPTVTVNETVTPETGTSDAVVTSKMMGDESVDPMAPVWPLPLTAEIAAGVGDVGLVESLHAVNIVASAVATIQKVLPRAAAISEGITVYIPWSWTISSIHFLQHVNAAIPYLSFRAVVIPSAARNRDHPEREAPLPGRLRFLAFGSE